MKVTFFTLGCKVNQHETGAMQQLFFEHGYTICPDTEDADVYVVNSCTVTAAGDKKSLQWLRRAKRRNPASVTVLTGCYPQAYPDEAALAGADIVLGNACRKDIFACIDAFLATGRPQIHIVPHLPDERFEELAMEHFPAHTRAFMKIEDGCNRACAYCVIPRARGRVRSRSPESIVAETKALVSAGYREIVYSGINLSCYGIDNGSSLAQAMEQAAAVPGLARLRLGSLEPDLLSDDTLIRLSRIEKLCPQFHLSLQSGCNRTLARMNRKYTAEAYSMVLARIQKLFDRPAFTTDVIVGFPGETDEDFQESLSYVEHCKFLKVHVFSYSPRPGTAGAEMPGQIPEPEKSRRNRLMSQCAEESRLALMQEACGQEEEVLLEKPLPDGRFTGYTRRFLPVLLEAPGHHAGDIVPVRLDAAENGRCRAILKK
ncbi:MAG: tRNA (N(6)-L-threonylcarbamoyladenosine(37)-C(2))-methylthiotransferase MtaB [Oscillospiraceae bacterium]|nr:tRNA (N(6)-L-threonylcarbamoyladenosine(37)-C(2))-methylthiotransferase MtaB [Oscillospiraceae bacterium]